MDFGLVQEERLMQIAAEGIDPEIPPRLPVDRELRPVAAVNYVSGNLEGALAKWRFQPGAPQSTLALELLAEALADAGNEEALPVIARLAARAPVEADAALARLRYRQGGRSEAVALLPHVPWDAPRLLPAGARRSQRRSPPRRRSVPRVRGVAELARLPLIRLTAWSAAPGSSA